jgi:hypothetical protein
MSVTWRFANMKQLLEKWRRRRTSLYPDAAQQLGRSVALFAREQAIRQSSFRRYVLGRGRVTIASDRYGRQRAGPYSKRLPTGSGPTADEELNIQTGDYVKSWFVQSLGSASGGSAAYGLGNRAPHAKYIHTIGGPGWMRERHILKGITEATQLRSMRPQARRFHDRALGQASMGR